MSAEQLNKVDSVAEDLSSASFGGVQQAQNQSDDNVVIDQDTEMSQKRKS